MLKEALYMLPVQINTNEKFLFRLWSMYQIKIQQTKIALTKI